MRDANSGWPRIFANYMTDGDDVRRMVAGFRIARQIAATEPLASLVVEAVRPPAECVSNDEIVGYCRAVATTVFHPCGTCRMGEDDLAVVDSQLRVRGMENLRVVDASVMPTVPAPNIQPATIMIAERGSDLIRQGFRHTDGASAAAKPTG